MNITYHKATLDDIHQVVENRIEAAKVLTGPPKEGEEDILRSHLYEYLKHALPDQTYICWLAKDGEEIVGAGGMVIRLSPGNFKIPTGKAGYIMSMYTRDAYRNRGIAATILNKLQDSARELGVSYFELHASKLGEPVYVKNGFKMHHEPTYRKIVEQ
jgi:GNAT superfamily N-acetyltransferase